METDKRQGQVALPTRAIEDVFDAARYSCRWNDIYLPLSNKTLRKIPVNRELLDSAGGSWGVVLCMTADKSLQICEVIDKLGMLPDDIGKVICLDCENMPGRCQPEALASVLVKLGVVPVYIEGGMLHLAGDGWLVSNKELLLHDISKSIFTIQYCGPASRLGKKAQLDIAHLHRQERSVAHELALRRELLRILPKWPASAPIADGVDVLCYGLEPQVEPLVFDYRLYERVLSYGCRISETTVQEIGDADITRAWDGRASEQEKVFSDVICIWTAQLSKWKIRLGEYEPDELGQLAELGEVLGIRASVEAYLSGVPLEDVQI